MNSHFFLRGRPQPAVSTLFLDSLINISFWVVSIVSVYLIIEKVRFRKYVEAIEKEKTRNELNFLRAQFNPHFLFNSINSIYGHIDKKNSTARTMLLTFSEMLRYQLYECNVELIDIDREINYIRNYVAIQQSRREENLLVDLEVKEDVRGFKIAPMLFIAFVENAFKYVSTEESCDNVVGISFRMESDELLFRTYNTKEKRNGHPIRHQGIGIQNVKRRLELLYPDRYDLSIHNNDRLFEVDLKIKVP
jgi:LytS/YehU family sensor histidine kinase